MTNGGSTTPDQYGCHRNVKAIHQLCFQEVRNRHTTAFDKNAAETTLMENPHQGMKIKLAIVRGQCDHLNLLSGHRFLALPLSNHPQCGATGFMKDLSIRIQAALRVQHNPDGVGT